MFENFNFPSNFLNNPRIISIFMSNLQSESTGYYFLYIYVILFRATHSETLKLDCQRKLSQRQNNFYSNVGYNKNW